MYLSAKADVEKRENTNKNAINNFFILTSTNNVRVPIDALDIRPHHLALFTI
jgi:hypothetical protein